jgi:hypothetical protein
MGRAATSYAFIHYKLFIRLLDSSFPLNSGASQVVEMAIIPM